MNARSNKWLDRFVRSTATKHKAQQALETIAFSAGRKESVFPAKHGCLRCFLVVFVLGPHPICRSPHQFPSKVLQGFTYRVNVRLYFCQWAWMVTGSCCFHCQSRGVPSPKWMEVIGVPLWRNAGPFGPFQTRDMKAEMWKSLCVRATLPQVHQDGHLYLVGHGSHADAWQE